MNYSIYNQLYSLLIFIINGIVIGILFDIFRIIRRSFKTSDIITYIEDILFWIITGLTLIYTIFKFNSGEIRLYIFIGLMIGIIAYLLTISKYFIRISVIIISYIKKIIYYPIKLIKTILVQFRNMFFNPFSFVVINLHSFFSRILQKSHKKQKN